MSTNITIRLLSTFREFKSAQRLEEQVWGLSANDTLPLTFMLASHASGAMWHGAFDESKLVGFAFGFLGQDCDGLMLHSHMLAVLPEYRDRNVGRELKLSQRQAALAARIPKITWTFDPLQSRNAHLNFEILGVVSRMYRVNFYGSETSSHLHQNGTDRLWVEWELNSPVVLEKLQRTSHRTGASDNVRSLTPLVKFDADGLPQRTELGEALSRQTLAIEIPSDMGSLEAQNRVAAQAWREATRWGFTKALEQGFVVQDFRRSIGDAQGPGVYFLRRSFE
jgi:predicted GNAT superfamily acetyltransferase